MSDYNYVSFYKGLMEEDMHFQGGPGPGEMAPEIDLATIANERFSLHSFKKIKPVLIEFGSIT